MALLLAGLVVAAPDAGVPARFSWDVPGQLTAVPVGGQLEAGGLPLKVYMARSKLGLDELVLHYARRFREAGYYLPMRRLGPLPGLKLPRVVALDVESRVSYLVYGWPEADGTTTLVLGAADLGAQRPSGGGRLPAFPGAKGVVTFSLEYADALAFNAAATEAEVIDFYRAVLPPAGWVEREAGVFVRGGRAVRVLARPSGQGPLGVVVLEQPDAPQLAGAP